MKSDEAGVRLYFDGGTFPLNPGHGGCGAVIIQENDEQSFSKYLGENITNNQAEYGGLILGLEKALEMNISSLEVKGDSELVICQVIGSYRCRNSGLRPLHRQAISLAKQFEHIHFDWIPREINKKADAAATEAIQSVLPQSKAIIPDNLPLCKAREGLKKRINHLNQQGDGAKFKEWIQLKSGRDQFSSLRGARLHEAVPDSVLDAISQALIEDEQDLLDKSLRWYLRGLKPALAVKKARVDAEISANITRKKSAL